MILESAIYSKLHPFHVNGALDPTGFETALGSEIAHHLARLRMHTGLTARHHFITSTVLTSSMNRATPSWQGLTRAIQTQGANAPLCYINAYECTGWGYILRLMQQLQLFDQAVLISILDVNAFDMTCWNQHEQWGNSGFGLATLQVQLSKHDHSASDTLQISASTGNNPFNHFALAVRKQLMADETICAAMPFFPQATQILFDRILSRFPHLSDRHPQWGHCFGSDPWLSMILSHRDGYDFSQHQHVLACSLAYSGYYSLAKLTLADGGLFDVIPALQETER